MIRYLLLVAFIFGPWVSFAQEQSMPAKEYKSPKEYVEAIDFALASFQKGEITSLEFERVFFPVGDMQFFLSYNFENPEVASLLQRIQKSRVSEAVASNISAYISGQQKQRDIYLRKAHPEIAKPVPLFSGGFAPPDPPPSTTPDPTSAPLWLNAQKAAGKSESPPLGPSQAISRESIPLQKLQPSPIPTVAEKAIQKTSDFPIIPILVLAVVIIASAVFLMRRKVL